MAQTMIEWTARRLSTGRVIPGYTFNPWWGCHKVSQECKQCYAEGIAARYGHRVWGPATTTARRFFGEAHWHEPLLGPLDLTLWLPSLQWVIVGGESGAGARPMWPAWARSLREQCSAAGVPFFFKQWGGCTHSAGGRLLEGRTWDEMPPERPMPAQSEQEQVSCS
jgi:protein gp37